jgi:hypothetical protein
MRNPPSTISWLAAIATCLGVPVNAAADLAAETLLRWHRVAAGIDSDGATAVALEPGGNRLAIGDARGVLIGRATPVERSGQPTRQTGESGRPGFERSFRRMLQRGPVRDLAFAADGSLLVATDDGGYRMDREGRHTRLALGPGAARAVTRIAIRGGVSAVATGNGVFVSRDATTWHRLAGAMPGGEAHAVALRTSGSGFVCWSIVASELWRVELEPSRDAWIATASSRTALPPGVRDDRALDIAVDLGPAALVIVFPTTLAVMEGAGTSGGAAPGRPPAPSPEWTVVRPQLPPGASARRLIRGAGRFWLATDRGLLVSAALAGPWRRAAPPAGTAAIAAVVAGPEAIIAATQDGAWAARIDAAASGALSPAVGGPSSSGAPSSAAAGTLLAVPEDPPIVAVHRAAVHYLGLERSRMEALRRGARQRGWWPLVTVRGGAGWVRDHSVDYDEAFLSGETRFLTDRDVERGDDFDVSLTLSWDLRDVAYEPESIDVSHEAREVIELRDDVLDEITQLYFERRALLASLRAAGSPATPEAQRLRLRADELAASIDAWTGGWFSSRVPALAPEIRTPGP